MHPTLIVFATLLALATAAPSEADPSCAKGLTFLEDCTTYIACAHGKAYVQSCNAGLFWDGEACNYASEVPECDANGRRVIPEEDLVLLPQPVDPGNQEPEEPVPEEPLPTNPEQCPHKPYYYIANPDNSNSFYICLNGEPKGTGKCQVGLVFSQQNQYCS